MKIEIIDITQYVYFMRDNKVVREKLRSVAIALKVDSSYNAGYEETIIYTTSANEKLEPDQIFTSREELLKSL